MHFNHVRNSMNKYNKIEEIEQLQWCLPSACRYGSNFFCKWRDNSQISVLFSSRCLLKCLQEIVIINQCGERKFLNSKQAQQEIVSVHLLRGAGSAVTFPRCVFFLSKTKGFSFSLQERARWVKSLQEEVSMLLCLGSFRLITVNWLWLQVRQKKSQLFRHSCLKKFPKNNFLRRRDTRLYPKNRFLDWKKYESSFRSHPNDFIHISKYIFVFHFFRSLWCRSETLSKDSKLEIFAENSMKCLHLEMKSHKFRRWSLFRLKRVVQEHSIRKNFIINLQYFRIQLPICFKTIGREIKFPNCFRL